MIIVAVIFLSPVAKSTWKMKFRRKFKKDRFRENYLREISLNHAYSGYSRHLQKQIGIRVMAGEDVISPTPRLIGGDSDIFFFNILSLVTKSFFKYSCTTETSFSLLDHCPSLRDWVLFDTSSCRIISERFLQILVSQSCALECSLFAVLLASP